MLKSVSLISQNIVSKDHIFRKCQESRLVGDRLHTADIIRRILRIRKFKFEWFEERLCLLVEVVLLQVVNNANVVDVAAACRFKLVRLELQVLILWRRLLTAAIVLSKRSRSALFVQQKLLSYCWLRPLQSLLVQTRLDARFVCPLDTLVGHLVLLVCPFHSYQHWIVHQPVLHQKFTVPL